MRHRYRRPARIAGTAVLATGLVALAVAPAGIGLVLCVVGGYVLLSSI